MMAVGTTHQGWAIAHQARILEGMEQMRQGLAAWGGTGAKLILPYWHALLAETYWLSKQPDKGLLAVDHALTASLKKR
jgi:predicted ATPase